ncbi:MAG TPA: hypothetical protein VL403_12900 [Candidatus Kryptonia bacterium]|nr:hypothetical protein [Candidatus Kryptonia bacterium]
MATIITFTPLQPPRRTHVGADGRLLLHVCEDVNGRKHRQRLPLGSVRGVSYLDALCLHCGAHVVWVDEDQPRLADYDDEPT